MIPSGAELELLFDRLFRRSHRTVLRGGAPEPLYSPPDGDDPGQIRYREDFVSSALHEVAHWCVAGAQRRTQLDYGYWYAPDGRSADQQAEFERVEVAPQALEWVFSEACGVPFRPSADNVLSDLGPSQGFLDALTERRAALSAGGLRGRAAVFEAALRARFS